MGIVARSQNISWVSVADPTRPFEVGERGAIRTIPAAGFDEMYVCEMRVPPAREKLWKDVECHCGKSVYKGGTHMTGANGIPANRMCDASSSRELL